MLTGSLSLGSHQQVQPGGDSPTRRHPATPAAADARARRRGGEGGLDTDQPVGERREPRSHPSGGRHPAAHRLARAPESQGKLLPTDTVFLVCVACLADGGDGFGAQCVEKGVAALSNLATRKPCREAIRKNGGVVPLVALLDTEIPELLCGSAGTLANMGTWWFERNRQVFFCGHTASLLPSPSLITASKHDVNREAICSEGAVPRLLQMLGHQDSMVRTEAFAALRNLSRCVRPGWPLLLFYTAWCAHPAVLLVRSGRGLQPRPAKVCDAAGGSRHLPGDEGRRGPVPEPGAGVGRSCSVGDDDCTARR